MKGYRDREREHAADEDRSYYDYVLKPRLDECAFDAVAGRKSPFPGEREEANQTQRKVEKQEP